MNLNLNLNLNKPLVFIKVATTGMKPVDEKAAIGDRIIEISLTRIETDRQVKNGTRLINPGRPIPAEATLINGITDADVANMPNFASVANNIHSFIGDADFIGFGISNFDLKFLVEEFNRVGIPFTIYGRNIIDLSTIFNEMEKRDFRAAAYKFAGQNISDEPIGSATYNNICLDILNGMVSSYSNDERFQNPNPVNLNQTFNKNKNLLDIHGKLKLNESGIPVFNFSKYKGMTVADIYISDYSFCDWCMNVSDLPGDTKYLLRRIIEKQRANSAQNA